MKKLGILVLSVAILTLSISGCGITKTEKAQFPVKIGEVQISARPEKVVSLSPSLTSALYALGYGNRVVGVDNRSDRPTAADALPDCGTALRPDVERILATGANVVFSPTPLPEKEANALLRENVTIVTIGRGNATEEIVTQFHNLITAMDGLNKGNSAKLQLSYYASATVDYLLQSMRSLEKGQSAIYIAEMDFNLATSDTFMGYLLEGMGFENQAGGDYQNWNFPAEKEADLNPDTIFYADHIPVEKITQSPYYKNTNAVKNGNLIPLDSRLLEEQSPFIFEYLYLTMKENFPDAFTQPRPSIALPPTVEETQPQGLWDKFLSFFN